MANANRSKRHPTAMATPYGLFTTGHGRTAWVAFHKTSLDFLGQITNGSPAAKPITPTITSPHDAPGLCRRPSSTSNNFSSPPHVDLISAYWPHTDVLNTIASGCGPPLSDSSMLPLRSSPLIGSSG